MNKYTSALAVTAAAIGLLGAPDAASAFVLGGTIDGEEAFGLLGATIDLAAEGRIGDRGGAAEHEFNIHYDNPSGGQTVPTEYRYFNWENGKAEDFTVAFANDLLTYEIGGQTLTYDITGPLDDMFIRTTARVNNSSVAVDNLKLNGTAIGETSSFACTDPTGCGYFDSSQYLWLANLDESFTLTGTTTMSWTGRAPTRSRLAFQVKLGDAPDPEVRDDVVAVPEPASMSLLSVGALGLLLTGLRRRQQHS